MANLLIGAIVALVFAIKYCRKSKKETTTKTMLFKEFKEAVERQKAKTEKKTVVEEV